MTEEKMTLWSKLKKVLLVFLGVVLIVFFMLLVFPTKKSLNPLYQDIFRTNINNIKDAAEKYFTNERMPKNKGDKVKLSLRQMLDMKLLLPFVDRNGNSCDLEKSYVEITKNETEYEMKVNLSCSDQQAYIIEFLGCTDYCIDCGKKEIKEEAKTTTKNQKRTEYQLKKTYASKVANGYMCDEGYTLKGNKCIKDVTYTDKVDAKKYYAYKTETVDAKYKETKAYKYLYEKEVITYKEVADTSSPIFQETYSNVIGTYKQYVCDGFTYFRDSNSSTTYKSSDYVYTKRVVLTYVPTDTYNTKYVYRGMDYDKCSDTCTLNPYYIYDVYTRTTSAVTQSYSQLSATCNVVQKDIPIYGLKLTFQGYKKNQVAETSKQTIWSYTKDNSVLKSEGYKYTGTYEVDSDRTTKTYYCSSDEYELNGTKCEKQVKYIYDYSCPAGYTLNGDVCSRLITTQKIINAKTTYTTVNSVAYRWSTSKEVSGWTFTGNTRTVQY